MDEVLRQVGFGVCGGRLMDIGDSRFAAVDAVALTTTNDPPTMA